MWKLEWRIFFDGSISFSHRWQRHVFLIGTCLKGEDVNKVLHTIHMQLVVSRYWLVAGIFSHSDDSRHRNSKIITWRTLNIASIFRFGVSSLPQNADISANTFRTRKCCWSRSLSLAPTNFHVCNGNSFSQAYLTNGVDSICAWNSNEMI